jgi:hypothetical protein
LIHLYVTFIAGIQGTVFAPRQVANPRNRHAAIIDSARFEKEKIVAEEKRRRKLRKMFALKGTSKYA